MREKIKRVLGRGASAVLGLGLAHYGLRISDLATVDKGTQVLLLLRFRELARSGGPLPRLDEVGFRAFSQTIEDGILVYLFALVGTDSMRAVEIGSGDGIECNTANLVVHHGWSALMVDGDAYQIERGRNMYARRAETWVHPPSLVTAYVTAENIEALLQKHGFHEDVDLLSIDIDGIDYWIWKSIRSIRPRVVVVEFNNIWGPEHAVTVPNNPEFHRMRTPEYNGASLAAMVKLGREKGYRFVGANRFGYNAFFVREDLARDLLPEASLESALTHPYVKHRWKTQRPASLEGWIQV